jgi:hypothetical protein
MIGKVAMRAACGLMSGEDARIPKGFNKEMIEVGLRSLQTRKRKITASSMR